MLNKKEIETEVTELNNFQELVSTYEEIAASRMRKVRGWVLQSRDFLSGLTAIFADVKSSYKAKLITLGETKQAEQFSKMSLIKHNGKSVAVLISANTRLYGPLLTNTFELFAKHLEQSKTDIVIIGKVGKTLFEEKFSGVSYQYFELSDQTVEAGSLHDLVTLLVVYDNISVFYGQYQNTITQKPFMAEISSNEFINQEQIQAKAAFIFEPSLEKLVTFFESEMFASLFEQTIQESQLGKFASRMVALDLALENVGNELRKVLLERRRVIHEGINKKQQDLLTGISLWSK